MCFSFLLFWSFSSNYQDKYCMRTLTRYSRINYINQYITEYVVHVYTLTRVLYSVVITWQSNPPVSQFNSLCNEFTSVWSMFVYNKDFLFVDVQSLVIQGLFTVCCHCCLQVVGTGQDRPCGTMFCSLPYQAKTYIQTVRDTYIFTVCSGKVGH